MSVEVAKLSPNMFLEICNIVVFIFVVTAFCYVEVKIERLSTGPRPKGPLSEFVAFRQAGETYICPYVPTENPLIAL